MNLISFDINNIDTRVKKRIDKEMKIPPTWNLPPFDLEVNQFQWKLSVKKGTTKYHFVLTTHVNYPFKSPEIETVKKMPESLEVHCGYLRIFFNKTWVPYHL